MLKLSIAHALCVGRAVLVILVLPLLVSSIAVVASSSGTAAQEQTISSSKASATLQTDFILPKGKATALASLLSGVNPKYRVTFLLEENDTNGNTKMALNGDREAVNAVSAIVALVKGTMKTHQERIAHDHEVLRDHLNKRRGTKQ